MRFTASVLQVGDRASQLVQILSIEGMNRDSAKRICDTMLQLVTVASDDEFEALAGGFKIKPGKPETQEPTFEPKAPDNDTVLHYRPKK